MRLKHSIITFGIIALIFMFAGCGKQQANKENNNPNSQSIPTLTIKIGSNSYEVSCPPDKEKYFNALSTSEGIVWSPVPSMEGQYLGVHLTSPYTFYLSPSTMTKLDTNHAQKILELPLQMDTAIGN